VQEQERRMKFLLRTGVENAIQQASILFTGETTFVECAHTAKTSHAAMR